MVAIINNENQIISRAMRLIGFILNSKIIEALFHLVSRLIRRSTLLSQNVFFIILISFSGVVTTGPVNAQEELGISQAELEQILAPIALYPDSLLSHILIGSTYPLEVVAANRWSLTNSSLRSDKVLQQAEKQDWDPSIQALTAFPDVLQRMSEDLDWTQALGDIFLFDEELVLSSVQNLRQRAQESGALENLSHLRVVNDGKHIVLEPVVQDIIYVPHYDVQVVYGPWLWRDYPPVHWAYGHYGLGFIWGRGTYVGSKLSFNGFRWRRSHIVRINRNSFYPKSNSKLSYRNAKRWVHNPIHRRGVYYRHARVNKRFTPNRVHKIKSRFFYNNPRISKSIKSRRAASSRRVVNIKQRLKSDRRFETRQVQNNRVQNNRVQNNRVQNNRVQNNRVQNNRVQNNRVQNNRVQNNRVQNNRVQNNRVQNSQVQNNQVQNSRVLNSNNNRRSKKPTFSSGVKKTHRSKSSFNTRIKQKK